MRLLHLADLHLDAPFSGADAIDAAAGRAAQRETLRRYIEYADANDVPLVVIAGDLFDGAYVTRDSIEALTDIFGHAKCRIVISPGNHDPLTESSPYALMRFPENVHVFDSPCVTHFDFPGVRVYGYAFTEPHMTSSPLAGFSVEPCDVLCILVAHADLDVPLSPYAPVSSEVLAACGFEYAALGHIHKASVIRRGGMTAAYSGCLMGRGFDETGRKGALLCDVEKGNVTVAPLYLTKRRYEKVHLTLSGEASIEEAAGKLSALCAEFDTSTVLRLYLDGVAAAGFTWDERRLGALIPAVSSLAVENGVLSADVAALESDTGVKGAYYRSLKRELLSEDEEKRAVAHTALYYGLAVLDGRDIAELK